MPECVMAKAGGCGPVVWHLPESGQYVCDEHKEIFDVGLRARGHSPNWQRISSPSAPSRGAGQRMPLRSQAPRKKWWQFWK